MKKIISIILVGSMLLGLAACEQKPAGKKKKSTKETKEKKTIEIEYDGETDKKTSATVEETAAETPAETTPEVEETEAPVPAKGPHAEHACPAPGVNEGCPEFDLSVPAIINGDRMFNYPSFIIADGDEAAVNAEALDIVQKASSDDLCYKSDVAYYVYNDTITITLRVVGDWDIIMYYIWVVDSTGHRLSNSEIMAKSINEYSSVAEAGTVATTLYINNKYDQGDGVPFIVDGHYNSNHQYASWFPEDPTSWTFNSDNINNNMTIGLDSDGCLIMVSGILSMGGAGIYDELYNDDGASLMDFFPDPYS